MSWQRVPYGGPFKGYQSSAAIHEIPSDRLGDNSQNYLYSPVEEKFTRRYGQAVYGDTFGAIVGLLESKWGAIPREVIELDSESLTGANGRKTHSVMFTDETDKEGALTIRDADNSTNLMLFGEYGSTHYPAASGGLNDLANIHYIVLPWWSENTAAPLGRGVSAAQRKTACAGSRRRVSLGGRTYFPNKHSSPMFWDQRFNPSTTTGSQKVHAGPWGNIPPLYPGRFFTSNLPAAGTSPRTWAAGDQFFVSVAFKMADGSVSQPYIPLAKYGSNKTSQYVDDFGLVTLPGTAGQYYDYIRITQVPIGPAGCVARILLRTPKADSLVGALPSINDLRVWHVIEDNATKTFDSYSGNDIGLLTQADAPFIRFNNTWPWRGRYAFQFDGRVGIGGDLSPNPAAIILSPMGRLASGDQNGGDTESTTGAFYFFARVRDNAGTHELQLRYLAGPPPGAPAQTTITLTSAKSLQDIVNEINATTTASTGKEWVAQLVPGVNPLITADKLLLTTGNDMGDDTGLVSDATTGNMRCWTNAMPGVLYLDQTYVSSLPTRPNSFMHTEAGAAQKLTGLISSALTWYVNGPGYDVKPPEDEGLFMGAWPLSDGCVVFYSKAVYLYQNRRGGTTGNDEDYRMYRISKRGCIAWNSITGGNGWAGWMAEDGYCVTDGSPNGERLISGAVWNLATGRGEWNYEVQQGIKSIAANDDSSRFVAAVIGNVLHWVYRSSGAVTGPDRRITYDFGATAGGSGLAQVLQVSGEPYPCSTPLTNKLGPMAAVRRGTDLLALAAVLESSAAYTTGDGRVDRFDYSGETTDNGTAVSADAYLKMDDFSERRRRKRMKHFTVKYKAPTGTTCRAYLSRVFPIASFTQYSLDNTGAGSFSVQTKRCRLANMSPSRVYEFRFGDDGGGDPSELWGIEAWVKLLETRR